MYLSLRHRSSTRGPPGRIMRLAATFLNYVYALKITQQFRRLGIPSIVIFLRAARKPAYNNGRGLLSLKGWIPIV